MGSSVVPLPLVAPGVQHIDTDLKARFPFASLPSSPEHLCCWAEKALKHVAA